MKETYINEFLSMPYPFVQAEYPFPASLIRDCKLVLLNDMRDPYVSIIKKEGSVLRIVLTSDEFSKIGEFIFSLDKGESTVSLEKHSEVTDSIYGYMSIGKVPDTNFMYSGKFVLYPLCIRRSTVSGYTEFYVNGVRYRCPAVFDINIGGSVSETAPFTFSRSIEPPALELDSRSSEFNAKCVTSVNGIECSSFSISVEPADAEIIKLPLYFTDGSKYVLSDNIPEPEKPGDDPVKGVFLYRFITPEKTESGDALSGAVQGCSVYSAGEKEV